jgi:histidinol-phosphate aminotransferase
LRIGYGLGRPDVIRRLEQRRISIPNRLGLRAALASYNDEAFLDHSRNMIRTGIGRTYSVLDELGLRYLPTQANFILFNVDKSARDFSRDMSARNIFVAPRTDHLDTWVRLSIGRSEHMDLFAEAIQDVFKNY